jgi:hypothetical protein
MNRGLGSIAALAAAWVACAVLPATAWAADVGANDDGALFEADGGAAFYARMAGLGLHETVIPVRFRPSAPDAIPMQDALDKAVASAVGAGLRVVFAVYPYPPRELEAGLGSPAAFAAWLTQVARRYPQVRQFVVGNEPNQPAFLRPQFGADGRNASAAVAGAYLAAGYDALKAVDPSIRVIGVGLSPRGNDAPHAPSNISTSPVRFLAALGQWYRASGRTAPLMDGFSFHPYPNRATDALATGYAWPSAGFANLDRVKQALWDAFHGTAQPTTVDGLKLYLDEVGWQVDTSGLSGYSGAENVPVTTELVQASVYGELVREAACDPDVAEVNIFGFRDDGLRTGFQAGLLHADGTPRASAEAVQQAIAETALGCAGVPVVWAPASGVTGARAGGPWVDGRVLVARAGAPVTVGTTAAADEGATARAFLLRMDGDGVLGVRRVRGGAAVAATAAVRLAPTRSGALRIRLPVGLAAGRYAVVVRFTAEENPGRRTAVTGQTFVVR